MPVKDKKQSNVRNLWKNHSSSNHFGRMTVTIIYASFTLLVRSVFAIRQSTYKPEQRGLSFQHGGGIRLSFRGVANISPRTLAHDISHEHWLQDIVNGGLSSSTAKTISL